MHAYNELKISGQTCYEKHVLDADGSSLFVRTTRTPLHVVKRDDGRTVYLIYDDNMSVISDAYAYLNADMAASPPNTRAKAAYAIRLLYCFLHLSDLTEGGISESVIVELRHFLSGIGAETGDCSLKTKRCNNTVNGYFSVYRDYYRSRGFSCEALFRKRRVGFNVEIGEPSSGRRDRYVNNAPARQYCEQGVPKYISPDEFKALYLTALSRGDILSAVIMRLMYVYGLRIGEVLGLTLEDVKEVKIGRSYHPVLILRNRMTDQKFQHAKGKEHVTNRGQYQTDDYISSRDEIFISYHTYEMLVAFIEQTHSAAMASRPEDYARTTADSVDEDWDSEFGNHYVFLNRLGRVLSGETWGNRLKWYFEREGIPLDWDCKKNNLSHRFRHGFAMFHAHFSSSPVNPVQLRDMLRHKWLSTVMVYYNPTPEDEVKIKTAFQESLFEVIPELKERPHACP